MRICCSRVGIIASCVQMCIQKPEDEGKRIGGSEFSQWSIKLLVMTTYSFIPSLVVPQIVIVHETFAAQTQAFQCLKISLEYLVRICILIDLTSDS